MRRIARRFLVIAWIVVAGACRRGSSERTPPASSAALPAQGLRDTSLLIVTFDTMRRDALGFAERTPFRPARTPVLDAFAATAVDFSRAWTVAPLTLPAHASLFTGLYPAVHGVRDNLGFRVPEEVTTIAERLAARGFSTGAVVAAPVVGRESGIGQGFGSFEGPSREDGVEEWAAPKVTSCAIAMLDRMAEPTRPYFLWVHYFDAHAPHVAPTTEAGTRARGPVARSDDADAYRGEVERIDRQFGRLVAAARAAARQRALCVVVAADHGEGLGDHGEATHGHLLQESTLRIPLLMQHPSWKSGRCDAVVSLVDVAPTLTELFDCPMGEAAQGRSLVPLLTDPEVRQVHDERTIFFESRLPWHEFGWAWLDGETDGRFKRVDRPRTALFDLDSDPGETKDVSDRWSDRAKSLEAARRAFDHACSNAAHGSTYAGPGGAVTQLGYVAARTEMRGDKADLAEPSDRFALIELRDRGLEELGRGNFEAAVEAFAALREQNVDPAPGTMLIAVARSRQAERLPDGPARVTALQNAEAAWRSAVESCPTEANRQFNLALTLLDLGKLDEAIAELERALALAPEDEAARRTLDETRRRRAAQRSDANR